MISKGEKGTSGGGGRKRGSTSSTATTSGLYLKQLRALLRKSFITRRVHFISTFFELTGPVLLPLFLVLFYSSINNNSSETSSGRQRHVNVNSTSSSTAGPVYSGPNTYTTFMELNFNEIDFRRKDRRQTEVLYAPNTPEAAKMVTSLIQSNVQVYGLATEALVHEALDKRIQNDTELELATDFLLLGLVFDEVEPATGQLRYCILVPSSKNFNSQAGLKYPIKMNQRPAKPNYFEYLEFTRVLAHVNREYLRKACEVHQSRGAQCDYLISRLSFTQMPYPRYQEPENSKLNVYDVVGLIIVLGYVLVVPLIVKRITDEKDNKVKEMLRMIGMSDLVFWSAHFVSFFVILVVQAAIFAYLFFLVEVPIVQLSSITFFFAFFLCYGAQLILFAMLITTIFNRPVIAVVATTILWIVASALIFRFQVPSIAQSINVEAGNFGRLLTSLTPCGSLIFYFSILGDLENKGTGLGWTNMATRQTIYGNFSVHVVLLCTLLSCLLYAFLIFYLDNVWPFQHGVPRSPFFICDPGYWRPKSPSSSRPQSGRAAPHLNPTKYEPDPDNLNARIMVQDLCKSFSSKFSLARKPAVNHLWLNIYENQLTVLLGHNGAGKTTTMSMICGLFPSSSGCIYVNGYNVFTQTNQARRSIGLCPQENIYFNELTVGQHLRLFALLKDFSSENVNKEVNYVLEMLALKDKKNVLASSLSGGMKRKLALGIALIGDTETLILDEPTSGMDPEARRVIWDLLISLRRQRTILLTTHYMEEADVLADRIAILNDGHLVCSGSGLFLKNAFGTGYRLRVAKAAFPTAHFDSRRFEAILCKYVPAAKLVSEVETEVVYSLEEEKETLMTTFPALFNDIEQHRENYGIDCCGLSYATLEDVFLKVGSDLQLTNGNGGEEGAHEEQTKNGAAGGELLLCKPGELTTGWTLFGSQFVGLLLKRLHYARRSPLMILLQLLIPGAIIALALYVDGKIRAGSERYTLPMDVEAIYGPDTKTWFYEPAVEGGEPAASTYYNNYLDLNKRKYGANVSRVPSAPSPTMANEAINRWILGRANESFTEYLQSYLYGLEVERAASLANGGGGIFNLWFNNEQFHSLPLAVVAFFESLLRALLPDALKDRLAISITSVPISSQSSSELFNMLFIVISWILTCLIFLPMAFPFLAASYVLYPIKEQASKAKLIQLMTGLSPALFWFVNFLFDLLNHLLATGVLFFIIYLLDSNSSMFGSGEQNSAPALFLLILSFGVATIPVVYAFSFFFTSPPSGYVFVVILYLVFGLIGNIIFSVFHICNNFLAMNVGGSWAESSLWLFRAVPIFSMLFGYQKIYLLSVMSGVCRSINIDQMCGSFTNETSRMVLGCCPAKCGNHCFSQASAFSFSSIGAGTELASLFLSGLVFFLLIVVYESQQRRIWRLFTMAGRLLCGLIGGGGGRHDSLHSQFTKGMLFSGDLDVEWEVARVEEEVANRRHMTDLLTVHKLKKDFDGFTAVDEISFGVKYDEVFGFLGVNGAGKTTTFSLLTGELMPTSGNAYIQKGQFALTEDMQQFQRCIGLCPQFDALLPQLSGEEMLYLFGRLRGVPKARLVRDVKNLVKMVGLEKHYANVSETYSGGNRRKLSLAIALIGSPSLIFLDEPSAGVDPAARRKIWQALGYVKRSLKSSVVLTSHSMEECEALCSRIAIMVNGKFRCLGSTQHLRSKYGQGYSVAIRLKREHESDTVYFTKIQVAMGRVLPSAVLKDCHQCLLHYHITDTGQTWSNIFSQMNALNETFHFEDYFVSDTTLEAIFIMFARRQKNPIRLSATITKNS